MRKIILTTLFAIFAMTSMVAQPRMARPMHFNKVYTIIDSLVLEKIPTPFPTEDDDYLMELPRNGKMVIAYNEDKTKAIVLRNGYTHGRHMQFDVEDNKARLVLYYMDKTIFCGYIYDKASKACKYFEAINEEEKEKLVDKLPFIRFIPTFYHEESQNN